MSQDNAEVTPPIVISSDPPSPTLDLFCTETFPFADSSFTTPDQNESQVSAPKPSSFSIAAPTDDDVITPITLPKPLKYTGKEERSPKRRKRSVTFSDKPAETFAVPPLERSTTKALYQSSQALSRSIIEGLVADAKEDTPENMSVDQAFELISTALWNSTGGNDTFSTTKNLSVYKCFNQIANAHTLL